MRRIILLNAKGGCGKTTVATNLAACFAARGYKTALFDYDPQFSALAWLRSRGSDLPLIHGVAAHEPNRAPLGGAWQLRVPRETQRVVVDTPAGCRAADFVGRILPTDTLLVPIQPSVMDIRATADFIRDLLLIAKVRPQDKRLGLIGNRTRPERSSFDTLQRFLDSLNIPLVQHLRDSQHYADAVEQGRGVCELPLGEAPQEWEHWRNILRWLEDGVPEAQAAATPQHSGTASIRPVVAPVVRPMPQQLPPAKPDAEQRAAAPAVPPRPLPAGPGLPPAVPVRREAPALRIPTFVSVAKDDGKRH